MSFVVFVDIKFLVFVNVDNVKVFNVGFCIVLWVGRYGYFYFMRCV